MKEKKEEDTSFAVAFLYIFYFLAEDPHSNWFQDGGFASNCTLCFRIKP